MLEGSIVTKGSIRTKDMAMAVGMTVMRSATALVQKNGICFSHHFVGLLVLVPRLLCTVDSGHQRYIIII